MTDSPTLSGCAWIIGFIIAGALFFTVIVGARENIASESVTIPSIAITAVAPTPAP